MAQIRDIKEQNHVTDRNLLFGRCAVQFLLAVGHLARAGGGVRGGVRGGGGDEAERLAGGALIAVEQRLEAVERAAGELDDGVRAGAVEVHGGVEGGQGHVGGEGV